MTIDKAIEILELRIKSPFGRANPDTIDATKLGIEALKLIQNLRIGPANWTTLDLPGETDK